MERYTISLKSVPNQKSEILPNVKLSEKIVGIVINHTKVKQGKLHAIVRCDAKLLRKIFKTPPTVIGLDILPFDIIDL